MTNSLQIAGQTDVGQLRQDNQDAFICKPLWAEHDALLVVIDGVGGYAGGAEAAAIAKAAIEQYMTTPTGDTLTMLREAVVHANNQIVKQKQQDQSLTRMCCVLTAAVADTNTQKVAFVHVGDTRLYRLRNQQLTKLTHDHSLVGVREDANQLTEREAMRHPRRNEILRDVGTLMHRVDDPDFLESGEAEFLPGDGLLLCSDGLTDMLTRADILDVLNGSSTPADHINELIEQANEAGGQDNITVVLAQFPAPVGGINGANAVPGSPVRQHVRTPKAYVPNPASVVSQSRTWLWPAVVLGVFLLLSAALWWAYVPTTPGMPATPKPADTTQLNTPTPLPDSAVGQPSSLLKPDSARQGP